MPPSSLAPMQALADATARILLVVDAQGTLILLSERASDQLSLELGRSLDVQLPGFSQQVRTVLSGRSRRCEVPVQVNGREYLAGVNPLYEQNEIRGAVCVLVDGSQLDTMTRQLPSVQALSRELDTIIDSSSDGLFVCDAQANVIRMNPASEAIHHVVAADIIGRNMRELVEEGFIDRSAALEASQTLQTVSLLQDKRGQKLISIATPVFDDQGALIRVVVSERDIAAIDRLQRELEEQQAIGDHLRDQMLAMQQVQLDRHQIVARSPSMIRIFEQAVKVARAESSVLILGESGVGKGLVVDWIHQNSRRSAHPLIKINCGAIPESLIEAELFGYVKGAFTGAQSGGKPGHLEMADGGTLFLDEVAELPLASQVKLLRFLEDGNLTRLGETRSRALSVRILAATHQDMEQMVAEGRFRLDLYYRLNVIPLHVPALRERPDCIVPLIQHYMEQFGAKAGTARRLTRKALEALTAYPYPGNVRELMNICERLVVMADTEVIDVPDLPPAVRAGGARQGLDLHDLPPDLPLQEVLNHVERALLLQAQTRCANQVEMARLLGINQSTVARKLRKHGLSG